MYITYALYIFLRLLLLLFKSTHKNLAPCDRNKEYQFSSRYYKKKNMITTKLLLKQSIIYDTNVAIY